eukprot:794728-Pelagomonas_calceolata.AAC.1
MAPVHRAKRYPLSRYKEPRTRPNQTIVRSKIDTRKYFVTESIPRVFDQNSKAHPPLQIGPSGLQDFTRGIAL